MIPDQIQTIARAISNCFLYDDEERLKLQIVLVQFAHEVAVATEKETLERFDRACGK